MIVNHSARLARWVIGTDPTSHPLQSVWLSYGRCMLFSCLCGMASSCFLIKRPIQTFSLRGIANLRSCSLRSTTCLDLRGQNQICCHEELSLLKNGTWFIILNHTHTSARVYTHARRPDNQRERAFIGIYESEDAHMYQLVTLFHINTLKTRVQRPHLCACGSISALLLHKQSASWPRFSYGAKSDHMLFTDCSYITFHPGILSKRSLLNPPLTVSSLILCCCFFFPPSSGCAQANTAELYHPVSHCVSLRVLSSQNSSRASRSRTPSAV